jgi:glutamate-1-semialdehyde 2,1-aminomutase
VLQGAENPASPETSQTDLLDAADRLLPGGVSGRSQLPRPVRFMPARAEGAWIYDVGGRRYVDYHAGAGALILGHGHPEVINALSQQVHKGVVFFGVTADVTLRLAEELVKAVPCAEKLVFTSTGSEATAYAMRLARAFVRREKILKFEGAYHGNHDSALVSQAPRTIANYPYARAESAGAPEALLRSILVAPYNDLDAVERILRESHREIAAIIVEPVQRAIFAAPGFLAGLRRLCDQYGCLLIFDEVVTGFRLGYGGAQEYFNVVPHLACYGKIIGGGLALGAVTGPAEILSLANGAEQMRPDYVLVNGTVHGAPIAAAAGLATLKVLRSDAGFYDRLNNRSRVLRRELQRIVDAYAIDATIVGDSSMWNVTFVKPVPTNHAGMLKEDKKRVAALDLHLVKHGIYVLPGNRRLTTSAHGDHEIEVTLRAMDGACRAVASGVLS